MSKRGCCEQYYQQQGYNTKGDNHGNIWHTWIGPPKDEPQEKTIVSWKGFCNLWAKHHKEMELSGISQDICSLCHVF